MSWDFNFTEEPPAAARSAAEAAAPDAVLVIPDLHPNGVWALQALADVRELPAILARHPEASFSFHALITGSFVCAVAESR